MTAQPPWLRGPVDGVTPLLQPVAHSLIDCAEDIRARMSGLSVETIVLMPFAVAYLAWRGHHGEMALSADNLPLVGKLALSGIVTAIPLLCFGQAARMLPFSMLGFMQYLSPSIQFLLAVFVMKELPPGNDWTSFVFVWLGLLVFSLDSYRVYRRERELKEALAEPREADETWDTLAEEELVPEAGRLP